MPRILPAHSSGLRPPAAPPALALLTALCVAIGACGGGEPGTAGEGQAATFDGRDGGEGLVEAARTLEGHRRVSLGITVTGIRDIREDRLRTQITGMLDGAGIEVVSPHPDVPALDVTVDAFLVTQQPPPFTTFVIDVEFNPVGRVPVAGRLRPARVVAYENSTYGIVPAVQAGQLYRATREQVERFIDAWKEANGAGSTGN